MTFSGLRGTADRRTTPLSVPAFGIASGLCAIAAVWMEVGQWPETRPGGPPAPALEYFAALELACLGIIAAILCAGFSCLIAVVSRIGR